MGCGPRPGFFFFFFLLFFLDRRLFSHKASKIVPAECVCVKYMKGLSVLIIGATGGLGKALTVEALSRDFIVSVLVRSKEKLGSELGAAATAKLAHVFEGDASSLDFVTEAAKGKDVVFLAVGANLPIATAVSKAVVAAASVKKLIGVAGATNVLNEDGSDFDWKTWVKVWPPAERAFHAHAPVIEAIKTVQSAGLKYAVLCPPLMKSTGEKSVHGISIRINRPSGQFLSYEDAAVAMIESAVVGDYDNCVFTAAAKKQ